MEDNTSQSKITEIEGDLFDAPDGAALIHACNCQGSWGKGIAQAFRTKYPAAFVIYRSYCRKYLDNPQRRTESQSITRSGQATRRIQLPEGSALIIPPQKKDYEKQQRKRHWIICLFTSRSFGRNVSSVNVILENTELAIADMKRQLDQLQTRQHESDIPVGEIWSCRFNAGLFGVDWTLSKRILEESGLEVTVVRPPGA